jgi:hypothetical protein
MSQGTCRHCGLQGVRKGIAEHAKICPRKSTRMTPSSASATIAGGAGGFGALVDSDSE